MVEHVGAFWCDTRPSAPTNPPDAVGSKGAVSDHWNECRTWIAFKDLAWAALWTTTSVEV